MTAVCPLLACRHDKQGVNTAHDDVAGGDIGQAGSA